MALNNVVQGGPHVQAHNDERAAINLLLARTPVLLLSANATVPSDTPVGTVIIRKSV